MLRMRVYCTDSLHINTSKTQVRNELSHLLFFFDAVFAFEVDLCCTVDRLMEPPGVFFAVRCDADSRGPFARPVV